MWPAKPYAAGGCGLRMASHVAMATPRPTDTTATMKLIPLTQVSHALQPGVTLPWGVRDGDGKLLLAKGFLLQDMGMLNTLLTRGMFVDAQDTANERDDAAPAQQSMSDRWAGL